MSYISVVSAKGAHGFQPFFSVCTAAHLVRGFLLSNYIKGDKGDCSNVRSRSFPKKSQPRRKNHSEGFYCGCCHSNVGDFAAVRSRSRRSRGGDAFSSHVPSHTSGRLSSRRALGSRRSNYIASSELFYNLIFRYGDAFCTKASHSPAENTLSQ